MRKNFLLGIMIVLGVWCLFYVGIKIDMWRLGYDIEDLQEKRTTLLRQQEALQVRLSALMDPQSIAQRARQQLGFKVPQEGQVVMISLDMFPEDESEMTIPVKLVREFSGKEGNAR